MEDRFAKDTQIFKSGYRSKDGQRRDLLGEMPFCLRRDYDFSRIKCLTDLIGAIDFTC